MTRAGCALAVVVAFVLPSHTSAAPDGAVVTKGGDQTAEIARDRVGDDDRARTLDSVLVTGQRKERYIARETIGAGLSSVPLREVPQSVQVIGRDLIDDQGALSLAELLGNNVASASASLARSIPFSTGSTQVRGQDVAIFRDGLRDIDYSDIDTSALNNVAGVEILKGPSGLLYGSGGPGGVINLLTKRPTETFQAQASATVGQRGTRIANGDLSIPLATGLGIRVTGEHEQSDHFVRFGEIDRRNFSGVLAYDNDALDVLVRYENLSNRDDGAATRVGLPTTGTLTDRDRLSIDRSTYLGEPALDFQRSFGDIVFAQVGYQVNDAIRVVAAARRTAVNFEQAEIRTLGLVDLDSGLVARTRARELDLSEDQNNARVFGAFDFATGAVTHELIAGVEQFDFDLYVDNRAISNDQIPAINVRDPQYLPDGTVFVRGPASISTSSDRTRELFVHDVARVGDLTITGAVRRSRTDFESNFADPARLDQTLYQLGATYALTEAASIFAGTSTGFDANSDIATTQSQTGERFDPEFFRQTEFGFKTKLMADVTGTVSIFQLDRDDILVADPVDPDFLIQVGAERTRGIETELVWLPSPALALRGGYAYLDAQITRDTDDTLVGNRRPGVPRHHVNAFGTYTVQSGPVRGLQFGLGATRAGAAYAAVTNTIEQPGHTVVNLSASYPFRHVRLDAFLTNALDETYFIARNNSVVNPGEPRLFTLRATARF
jgi:iron complex outermembrane receptor protein